LAVVPVDEVLLLIIKQREKINSDRQAIKERLLVGGHPVKLSSLRLLTFAVHGTKCVSCGLEATHFAIEKQIFNPCTDHPHLNLYGVDAEGTEVLFTHDHVLAQGLGGIDHLSNTQTMCYPCNQEKSIKETAESQMRKSQRRRNDGDL